MTADHWFKLYWWSGSTKWSEVEWYRGETVQNVPLMKVNNSSSMPSVATEVERAQQITEIVLTMMR